jgi:hypothetical protein
MKDIEEIVQIAQNGKLTCKTRNIKQHFHHVRQDQQDGTYQLYWNLVRHNLLTSSNKTQVPSKTDLHINKIFCTLPNHMVQPTNKSTEI